MATRLYIPLRNGVANVERILSGTRNRVRCYQILANSPSSSPPGRLRLSAGSLSLTSGRELSCSCVLSSTSEGGGRQHDSELLKETPTFAAESELRILPGDGDTAATSGTDAAGDLLSSAQVEDLAALGLGGYTPPGLVQSALELIHTNAHLPWWASIVAATVALRLALFPLAVRMQVNAAKIANINPIAQEMHKRMVAYKNIGNKVAEAQEAAKLLSIYREQGVHPITTLFMMPLVQIPIFISFFLAIKGMAKLPLESMKTGGVYWFTDLTVPDPTYVLPLLACLTFISNIELGGEGGAASSNQTHRNLKMFMRASAVLVLPISITFPSGLFMYWVTNSLFSTCQILFLKIPQVKLFFGIPKIIRPPEQK